MLDPVLSLFFNGTARRQAITGSVRDMEIRLINSTNRQKTRRYEKKWVDFGFSGHATNAACP